MSKNHPDDNIYSILGKLNALKPTPQEQHDAKVKAIYESVEAQGSILKGLRNIDPIEARLAQQLAESKKAKPDYIDIDKDGDKKEPMKKAAKSAKKDVAEDYASMGTGMGAQGGVVGEESCHDCAIGECTLHEDPMGDTEGAGVAEGWGTNGGDYVTLNDEPCAYWHGNGRLSNEYKELYAKLVPGSGAANTIEGEVLRAASKIYYRHYNDGDEFNEASFKQLLPFIGKVSSYDELAEKATEFALKANGNYHPNQGWNSSDVMHYGPPEGEDDDYDDEEIDEGEKVAVKGGTVYKGTYGTSYGDDESSKPKHVPRAGVKGRRPNAEKPDTTPKFDMPAGDIFGRTGSKIPAGKPGKVVKGKANDDRSRNQALDAAFAADEKVDEVLTKKTPASTFVKDFQKSTNPKFAGKSKSQRTKQALGAYYGMHPEKSNKTESRRIAESVNFRKMMDDADMSITEMLDALNNDVKDYKSSGQASDRLRDFMHLHHHMKKQMDEAGPVTYEIPAVQRRAAGAAPLTPAAVQSQDAARSMHPGMTKLNAPTPARSELDELAKLAGLKVPTGGMDEELDMEGNAFSGALATAKSQHQDSFDVDGKEYKVNEADAPFNEPKTNPVNGPKEQYMSMKASTLNPGEGDNGEKAQHPDKPTFKNGDNPLARPAANESVVKLEARLAQEYESIKKAS